MITLSFPRMIRAFVLETTALLLIVSLSCKDEPVKPPDDTPKPGKRDYTWTIDTLSYPGSFQTLMRDIWASSPRNAYAVGRNDRAGMGSMYHYDGIQWRPVGLLTREGGTLLQGFDLTAIHGFSPTDIYAVGQYIYHDPISGKFSDSSLVIHYDGAAWQEVALPRRRLLYDISASSPVDIWVVGRGTNSAFYYDGIRWNSDSFMVAVPDGGLFQVNAVAVFSASEVFALAVTSLYNPVQDTYYFLRRTRTRWSLVDSAVVDGSRSEIKWGYAGLWKSPWGRLYSVGIGVYEWQEEAWKIVLDNNLWLSDVFGTSEKNIFAVGQFGQVFHYNGTDWYRFTDFPPLSLTPTTEWFHAGWTDGKEVFIVGQDAHGHSSLVLHGK